MAQSQKTLLDDSEVSRMIATKALNDQVFRHQLLNCGNRKNYRAILQIIPTIREQIVDQAKLQAPDLANETPQDLTTYLKKNTNSRVLFPTNTPKEIRTKVKSVEGEHEWGWVGNPSSIVRFAVAFLQSTLRFQADPTPFPFERLPPELRLQVYRETLIGTIRTEKEHAQLVTVTPTRYKKQSFPFRAEVLLPKGESKGINVGLLAANRLVNNEAVAVLYQLRIFDFKTNVGAIAPFLRRFSEMGRRNLHGIAMDFYDKEEPDYCCGHRNNNVWGKGSGNQAAWSKACAYIVSNVNVKGLNLTTNVKVSAEFKSLKWVKDLVKIKKLRFLTLKVNQHYGSEVIRASYKEGSLSATDPCFNEHLVALFEYLRDEMLE